MRATPLVALLALTALSGCLGGTEDGSDNNPRFVAEFRDPPGFVYDKVGATLSIAITNVQEIKPGQIVGEGGAHQVCMHINGPIHRDDEGKPLCQLVGLANRETKNTDWWLPELEPGTHTLQVLNASTEVEVRSVPEIGERINGSLVDITLISGKETEDSSWQWNLTVHYHNGTVPIKVVLITAGGSIGSRSNIEYSGPETEASLIHKDQFAESYPTISALVATEDGTEPDEGLFLWCCHPAAA